MANNKDFIINNAVEISGSTKTTIGTSSPTTIGYNLVGATYDNKSFDVNSQLPDIYGGRFKPDGTKFYAINTSNSGSNERLEAYDLSTAWDISTISYNNENFGPEGQDTVPYGVDFKSDGTKMYIIGNTNDRIYQYTLSTAWDISTASYDSVFLSVNSQDSVPVDVRFKSDGTKFYITGLNTASIYQYALTTAWDLSTASYENKSFEHLSQTTANYGFDFNDNGTKLYIPEGGAADLIHQYTLSTAWDISTASYDSVTFYVGAVSANARCILFKPDGTKFYIIDGIEDKIFQYSSTKTKRTFDLSTGNYFINTPTLETQYDFSNAGTNQIFKLEVTGSQSGYDLAGATNTSRSFDFSSQSSTGYSFDFKPDGTKLYVSGRAQNSIFQYSLSTAYDLSTVAYSSKSYNVSAQGAEPMSIRFKPDGTKFYVMQAASYVIYQYSMSTAWDISTSSYDNKFGNQSDESIPRDFVFKPDGTSYWLVGQSADTVYRYNMSTAWDISTAGSSVASQSVSSEDTFPSGIDFNDDGTKMFILGNTNDKIFSYTLSTAYDITTASYDSVFVSLISGVSPYTLRFYNGGRKMYWLNHSLDDIHEYDGGRQFSIEYGTNVNFVGGTAFTSPELNEKNIYSFVTNNTGTSYTAINQASSSNTTASTYTVTSSETQNDDNVYVTPPDQTFTVTVQSVSSANKYFIDGVQQPTLTLTEGNTYRFDQSDSSNSGHPLRLSTTSDGTHGSGSEYTTGVITSGTPGSSGAYTQITVASGAPTLYYYCSNHSGMGGQANTP
tara:strand:+ start:5016 stop:7361 length:2346 start_codon:yes stop_codon:yes gene_type:complete